MDSINIKILAVDDNFDNLITLQALVSESFPNAVIVNALNGKEALQLAEKENPDLILLDVVMPEMDGFEVCQKLKSDPILANIPVVFVTALKGDKESRIRGLEVGAEAFLAKPIDQSELVAEIRAMMKIRTAYLYKQKENSNLLTLVEFQTRELRTTHTATLNLMEDLRAENEVRKATEEALKASEALYRSILDASPDNITVSTLEGRIKMISPNGLKLIGFKEEEIIGRYLGEFLIPEDTERAIRNIEGMFNGIFNGSEEYRLIHADKSIIPVEINAEFVRNDAGEPMQIVFAIRDITERIRNQKAILESEQKYRLITEKISDVVWIMDLTGKSLFVSQSIENFTGYTVDEYLKQSISERFTPESAALALSIFEDEVNIYKSTNVRRKDFKKILILDYRCKDGKSKTGELLITPYYDETHTLIGIHGVTRDITQRIEAKKALSESEEKFRFMAENTSDVLWHMDKDFCFDYISPSIERIQGYKPDDLIGKQLFSIMNEDGIRQIQEVSSSVSEKLEKGELPKEMQFEYESICKDGSWIWVEVNVSIHFDKDMRPEGFHGVTRDISERKKNEAILLQTRQNYETFFNTIDDFLFVLDEQGNIIHTNTTVNERLEYQGTELIGKSVLEVHPPERREEAGRIVGEMLMGITEMCPVPLITKSGAHIPVETRISKGFWDGKPVIFGVTKDITNLVFSEEKFSKLFHFNPSAAGLSDITTGQYIEVNQAFNDLLGFEEREVVGKTAIELGILDEKNKELLYSKLDSNGNVSDTEIDLIAKNGEIKNVSISGQNIVVQNQVYRFTVVHDLTEQKQSQQALLQSEEKYRSLVENSPNGIAIYQDGKFVYVNATGLKIFGVNNADQLLGKPVLSIVHPDSLDAVVKRVSKVSSGSQVPPLEEKLLRYDGSIFYAEVAAIGTTFNGKPAGQVIVNDITDRKLADVRLGESEEKFRDMANLLPQVVFELDLSGTITYVNQQAQNLFGYEIDELIGKNSIIVHVPEERNRIVEGIRNKLAGISTENNEYRMVRKDGSEFPALIYTSLVVNKNIPVGVRGVLVDITAQKKAEQSIRHIARLYALQSQINQAIVTSKNEQILFETICKVAVKYGEFKMSWMAVYDETEEKLKPICHAGFNDGYIESLNIVPGDTKTGRGPTGLAYHEDRVVFCNDIATDEMMKPWKVEALKRGYKSSFSTPVSRKRKRYATFTLYAVEKDFFQEDEQKLLSEIGENITFALDAFDSESERKEVEIALIESESKYRSLMDNSPEGITIYVDGKVAYINKEALRLMRANDKSEMLGKTIVDFIHPDNVELVIERMKLVAMAPVNSILPSVEEKYIRLDGTEVFVEIKVMPIIFEGKPAIQLAGHDISDRKKAEFALEQSRIELQTIYDNAPVMMCVVDEDRHIQFANQVFTSLTGVHEDIMKGGAVGRVVGCINSMDDTRGCGYGPKCGTCTLRMAMQKTFLTGMGQTNVEYQSTLEIGGVYRNVSLLGSTALIKNDDSKRLLMCLIDITDRKLTEEALQKSETLLRTFIDNSPFEIWARDNDNIGILENKKLTEHYGSIIGHSTTNDPRVDKDVMELWERNNARVFAGEIIDEEYEFVVNGSARQFQQIVFPIRNNHKILGIAGFNIDITDRKLAENALKESQAQLANFAAHLQSVREEERSILARDIHDDLGQILIAMKIDIGLLKQSVMRTIQPDEFEILRIKFEDLNKLVDNTLKSARRIMTDLRPEVLDLLGYVETVTQHLKSFEERTKILCIFTNNVDNLILDSQQSVALYRIVQEALNNTAKYSRATEVHVALNQQNDYLTLEISDNGVGFDMNDPKKRDSYGLMGMKERVILLEGKLEILSAPGSGTHIKVLMPYSDTPQL